MLKRVVYSSGEILPDASYGNGYDDSAANNLLPAATQPTVSVLFFEDDRETPRALADGETLVWDAKQPNALSAATRILTAGTFTKRTGSDIPPIYDAVVDTSGPLAMDLTDGASAPVVLSGQFAWYAANTVVPKQRSVRYPISLDNVVRQPDDVPPPGSSPAVFLTDGDIGNTVAAQDDPRFAALNNLQAPGVAFVREGAEGTPAMGYPAQPFPDVQAAVDACLGASITPHLCCLGIPGTDWGTIILAQDTTLYLYGEPGTTLAGIDADGVIGGELMDGTGGYSLVIYARGVSLGTVNTKGGDAGPVPDDFGGAYPVGGNPGTVTITADRWVAYDINATGGSSLSTPGAGSAVVLSGGKPGSILYISGGSSIGATGSCTVTDADLSAANFVGASLTYASCTGVDTMTASVATLTNNGGNSPDLGVFGAARAANTVLSGPASGANANPTFRALVTADLPTVPITKGGTGATTAGGALTALGASPLASPAFTGVPTVPTATAGTNTTQAASTAFVAVATSALAPTASPTFTGTVTAPSFKLNSNTGTILSSGNNIQLKLGTFSGADNGAFQVLASTINLGAPTTISGPLKIGTYTVATVPSASTYSGYYIDVSNASGGAGLFRSNGTNWLIPGTTTVLS